MPERAFRRAKLRCSAGKLRAREPTWLAGGVVLEQLFDAGDQEIGRKRLLEKRSGSPGGATAEDIVHVVGGHVQDRQCGPALCQTPTELAPVHTWHDDVGNDEVYGVGTSFEDVQRLTAMAGFEGTVPALSQGPAYQVPHAGLVIYHEHDTSGLVLRRGLRNGPRYVFRHITPGLAACDFATYPRGV